MARVSPLMIAPPLIFAGLALVFVFGMMRSDPDSLPSAREGQVAPPLQVDPLGEAEPLVAEALRAPGVKLVNFWASWCAPCRIEHPNLDRLAEEGVTIHGINYKDDPAKALAFLEELGNPYATLGADAKGRTALDWGVYGVPETYVIDGEGKILLRFPGPITERVLNETIRPAMERAGQPG
ncbi:DsbE family thiol:disulfide interchange protein [Oceaniglobus trochenteri]|uniref:DsbE family thiol:disulfide interchange protein n=1 Tax=Oceaniglobus trochenteri TaxID=2763260 RepID=UPI001D0018C2|nr:DsbE family thiol:disulfide interchange protein [Oceaniglobus trochenteri]